MSPPTIIVNKSTPLAAELFSRIGLVIPLESSEITRNAVRGADVIIVRSETRVDADLLEGSRVRFVGTVTIGTDHIDLEYLRSRRIPFVSAPGSNANSVKEYVVAALLALSKRTGRPLQGKTIGIVGVGNVGRRVAQAASALGMVPLLNDPPRARAEGEQGFLSLDALMEADIVTLHVPLTKDGPDRTHHLFDYNRIARMKPGSVLINTARGGVVDSKALKQALSASHLSAAVLDVWEDEPFLDEELLDLAFLGTPHIAGYSMEGKLNAVKMVFEGACRALNVRVPTDVRTDDRVEHERIVIPRELREVSEIVSFAVQKAYDIARDDASLRAVKNADRETKGRLFSSLRSEYRIRWEFSHYTVECGPEQKMAREVLHSLGFEG